MEWTGFERNWLRSKKILVKINPIYFRPTEVYEQHNKFLRKIYNTSEALFLIKGKIKVNFFDKNRKFFKKVILETGDIILFYAGTHGFEILKNSQMIEFKQGPYIKKKDKLLI
jgi:hypothetical protein